MDKRGSIGSEDGTEVAVEDSVEGGRRPAVTLLREEDTRAVHGYTPEYYRINRTGPRERIALRLPGKSRKGVALYNKTAFYLSEVLRKEELLIKLDTEEARRLAGSKDGSPVERKRRRRGYISTGEVE